jgi:chromosome segregation ATPase
MVAQQATFEDLQKENDSLREELEHVKEENERWKDSIRKYNNIKDSLEEQIDSLSEQIKKKDTEIARLRFDATTVGKEAKEIRKLTTALVTNNIHKQYDDHIKKTFQEYTPPNVEAIRTFGVRFFHDVIRA